MTTSSIVFGVTLAQDDEALREALATMCELIGADLGEPVEGFHARTPGRLAAAMARGDVDFAWLSPTLLLMDPGLATVVPLLSSVRQGAAVFHALLYCPTTYRAESLDQVRDARAAWVAPTSAAGYLVPRLSLQRKGYDPRRLFSSEDFYDTHGAVAAAVVDGKADVGATFGHFRGADAERGRLEGAGFQEHAPFRSVRILDVSGPIPADMIVAQPQVSITRRIAFAAALSRLTHDPVGAEPLRRVIGAEDFRAVTIEALVELQQLMRAAEEL